MLACRNISKAFGKGPLQREVLRGVSLTCAAGDKCILLGPSGSGKTTLLSILGCILSPCSGELEIGGQRVDPACKAQRERLRRRSIGFVFQQAQLLPFLSMEENVRIVARNAGMDGRQADARVAELFDRLGVSDLRRKSPRQASGGERQRVAIARAVVHRPAVVLADEPTAALDWLNGQAAVRLLSELATDEKTVLVTVTHDTRLLEWFDRRFTLDQGMLRET